MSSWKRLKEFASPSFPTEDRTQDDRTRVHKQEKRREQDLAYDSQSDRHRSNSSAQAAARTASYNEQHSKSREAYDAQYATQDSQPKPQSSLERGSFAPRASSPLGYSNQQATHQRHQHHEDAQTIIDQLKEQVDRRGRRVEELNEKNDRLIRENEKLARDMRTIQESSFDRLEDARWVPMDQKTINDEISEIRSEISRFAKSYASESFDRLRNESFEATAIKLWSTLGRVVRFDADGPAALKEIFEIRHAPRLCLMALISDYTHKHIFDNPFFFLDGEDTAMFAEKLSKNQDTKQFSRCSIFSSVYSEIRKCDERQGNIWRSDTIRRLNPDRLAQSEAAESLVHLTGGMAERACISLSKSFRGIISDEVLYRSLESSMREGFEADLDQIFVKAGRLSLKLWAQRPLLRTLYLGHLVDRTFDVSSDVMEPHALHKLDDPQDHSLDGKLTKVLVHPAVLAMGTHDADHYDRQQVWAKAVAWLES